MENNHLGHTVGAESPNHVEFSADSADSPVTPQPHGGNASPTVGEVPPSAEQREKDESTDMRLDAEPQISEAQADADAEVQDGGPGAQDTAEPQSAPFTEDDTSPQVEIHSDSAALPHVPPFKWEKEATIDYKYSDGKTWHQVGYRDTPQGRQIFERGIPLTEEDNDWTDDMSRIMRVPYNVQEVQRRQMLIFVESEAAADLLNRKLRVSSVAKDATATTTAGGLGCVQNTDIAKYVFKKAVIVLPTNDKEGLRHANEVCRICALKSSLRKIVELPHRSPGGGVEDYFGAGGTVAELLELIADAPHWILPTPTPGNNSTGGADSSQVPSGADADAVKALGQDSLQAQGGADPVCAEDPETDPGAGSESSADAAQYAHLMESLDTEEREDGNENTDSKSDEDSGEDGAEDDSDDDTGPESRTKASPAPPRPARVQVNFESIPADLRARDHWVLWRYELDDSEEKYTKVPYKPNGRLASTKVRATWSSFDTVKHAYERGGKDGKPFDGVGFVLTEELGLVGVDIDKQCEPRSGEWSTQALEVVHSLDSYTEVSPSGRGLRVFLFGQMPGPRCKRGHFEIYNSGRYLTVTGQIFPGSPTTIKPNQGAIDAFHKEYIATSPRPVECQYAPAFLLHALSDEDVLRRARAAKNGEKFRALFDAGDLSGHEGDHSAADLALCARLAHWTGRNALQMDALFRQSKLMRPKWDVVHYSDGKTYGMGTVELAVENCTKVCDPRSPLFEIPSAADIPAAPAGNEGKTIPYGPRQVLQLIYPEWPVAALDTEVAHAHRIAHYLSGELVFVKELGWMRFDGRAFLRDDRGYALTLAAIARLSKYVRAEANHLFAIAVLLEGANRPEDARAMRAAAQTHLGHTRRVEVRRFIDDSLAFAAGSPRLRSHVDKFNIRPWVVGFQNGVWDHGEFRAHRADDHFLELCPIEIEMGGNVSSPADAEAAQEWGRVLSRISGGDRDLERTLQDIAAYALSGACHLRTIPWAYGKKGTGKSTFTELLQTVLGKNAMPVSPDKLSSRADRARLGADLWNRRLAVCAEAGNKQLDAELLKTLSGGDTMGVRHLYKETFDAAPRHTLFLVSNDPPRLEAYDDALKDRVLALPFTHPLNKGGELELSGGHRIEDVRKQVNSPLVRGFAKWALEGLGRLYQSGEIFRAKVVVEASEQFWKDTDPMGEFWECVPLEDLRQGIHGRTLRDRYQQWCVGVGVAKPFGPVAFKRACESIGLQERRFTSENVRGWQMPPDPHRVCKDYVNHPDTGRPILTKLNIYGKPVVTGDFSTSNERGGGAST